MLRVCYEAMQHAWWLLVMVAVWQITDGSHAIQPAAARAARPIHPHAPGYGRIGRVQLSRRARSNGGDGDAAGGVEAARAAGPI